MSNFDQRESQRRANHSAIEKRRRERLSTTLDKLKHCTPASKDQQYIQKMQILENAIAYIKHLEGLVGVVKCPLSPESVCSTRSCSPLPPLELVKTSKSVKSVADIANLLN